MRVTELLGIPSCQAGHIELFDELALAQASIVLKVGSQSKRQRQATLT